MSPVRVAAAAAAATPTPQARAAGLKVAPAPPIHAPSFAHAVYEVARKEVLQYIRTKRLFVVGGIFVAVLTLLTVVLPLSVKDYLPFIEDIFRLQGTDPSAQNLVMRMFLTGFLILSGYFLITLLPIVLTADAVCSEWSSRTIFLLLSKPVSRSALVLGKFAGSGVTLISTVLALLVLDYLVLLVLLPDVPSPEQVGAFVGALGLIALGILAWTAIALFFSTLSRSSAASMILAISSFVIIFPLLGNLDLIIALIRYGGDFGGRSASELAIGWSQYLNPSSLMGTASDLLTPALGGSELNASPAVAPDAWTAAVGLLVHIVAFVGLSLLVVRRRNFE